MRAAAGVIRYPLGTMKKANQLRRMVTMAEYGLKKETVKAEDATAVRVRIYADDDREVVMRKDEFEARFEEAE